MGIWTRDPAALRRGLATYRVRILADSVGPNGVRITTWELTYPRFVHAELMTHRLFSRNSASSRAIPTKKLMRQIRRNPAVPVWWGRNQSGMQAREELSGARLWMVKRAWLAARWPALLAAWVLGAMGFHKQIANRILEPWMFITVIVTATEFDNWDKLRCHPDAQPEIGWVAKDMRRQRRENVPRILKAGEWHLPLVDDSDVRAACSNTKHGVGCLFLSDYCVEPTIDLKKVSAGRCARVSYLTHDGRRDLEEDVKLADKLMTSGHWSPFEHVAQALPGLIHYVGDKEADSYFETTAYKWSGNLRGWLQFRETVDTGFTKVTR